MKKIEIGDHVRGAVGSQEEIAAKQRAYYEEHKEEIAAKKRAYREAHKDEAAAYQRAYRARAKKNTAPDTAMSESGM